MLFLELALTALGAWLMSRKRVLCGGKELVAPGTIFVGLILVLILPINLGVGMAIGGAEGVKAARDHADFDPKRFARKYWWLDLAVTGSIAGAAALLAITSFRRPMYVPPPPDDPVGITDYRVVYQDMEYEERLKRKGRSEMDDEDKERPPPRR